MTEGSHRTWNAADIPRVWLAFSGALGSLTALGMRSFARLGLAQDDLGSLRRAEVTSPVGRGGWPGGGAGGGLRWSAVAGMNTGARCSCIQVRNFEKMRLPEPLSPSR